MKNVAQKLTTSSLIYVIAGILGIGSFALAVGNLLTTTKPGGLLITNTRIEPVDPHPGDTITFRVTILNPRIPPSTQGSLYVNWEGDDQVYERAERLPSLRRNESTTVTLTKLYPTKGEYVLFLQARQSGWKTTTARYDFSITDFVLPPTISLSLDPQTITAGQQSKLTWSTRDASSCIASGAWSGVQSLASSTFVKPPSLSTYTLTCSGINTSTAQSVTLTVNPAFAISCNATPSTGNLKQQISFDAQIPAMLRDSSVRWYGACVGTGLRCATQFETSGIKKSYVVATNNNKSLTASCDVYIQPPPPDTQAPTIPTGLKTSSVFPEQTTMRWEPSSDNVGVAGYRVLRNNSLVATTAKTEFINTELRASTTYTYRIIAFDAAGNTSDASPPVIVSTPPLPTICSTISCPKLSNPVNPRNYGATADGVTDDSTAFQSAVNAGNVYISSGTYLINKAVSITTSNKHIQCAPDAHIINTDPNNHNIFLIDGNVVPISNDSIIGCQFTGANSVPPLYFASPDQREWNIPVIARNRVNNFLLAGNSFDKFFGDAEFQTYAPTIALSGEGDKIIYNTFKNCGGYGVVFNSHRNGLIAYNTAIDCSIGVENDEATTQASGGNIIENNTVTVINGSGFMRGVGWSTDIAALLTGGGAAGADYSKNIVRNNTVSGRVGKNPSVLYQSSDKPSHDAQYLNNVCINGCECRFGCSSTNQVVATTTTTGTTSRPRLSQPE